MQGESDSEKKWQWFRSGEGALVLEVEWIERAARTQGGRSERSLAALKEVLQEESEQVEQMPLTEREAKNRRLRTGSRVCILGCECGRGRRRKSGLGDGHSGPH